MKKAIFTALSMIALMICTPANAQNQNEETTNANAITSTEDNGERKPIKSADLPEPVKETLAGADYKGWKIEETAYCVRREDDTVKHYEVSLKSASTGEIQVVKLDPDGKVML